MLEANADLWAVQAQARCITTNGSVRQDGRGVMGRGCALQAKIKFPGVDQYLGLQLQQHGNHVHELMCDGKWTLVSFPVKHLWSETASIALIRRSAEELVVLTTEREWKRVVLPRPGCGNGRLDWARVQPVLASLFDDRFLVVDFAKVPGARRARNEEESDGISEQGVPHRAPRQGR